MNKIEQKLRISSVGKRFSRNSKVGVKSCQVCGVKPKRLITHHIESLSKIVVDFDIKSMDDYYMSKNKIRSKLLDSNNALVVCDKCHQMIHYKELLGSN